MVEKGVLDSVKEGGIVGAGVGFGMGAARAYMFGREIDMKEFAKKVSEERAAMTSAASKGMLPSTSTSTASTFRPNVFPRLFKTTGAYAAVGAIFLGTETMLRNNRDKDDYWNRVIAGACAGSLVGVRSGSFFVSAGASAAMAASMIFMEVFNGTLGPTDKDYFKKRLDRIYRPEQSSQDNPSS